MAVSEIRQATVKRKTSETDIALFLRIDGSGEAEDLNFHHLQPRVYLA